MAASLPRLMHCLPVKTLHTLGHGFLSRLGPWRILYSRETWLGGASQGCPHLQQSDQCIPLGPYHQGSHTGSASPSLGRGHIQGSFVLGFYQCAAPHTRARSDAVSFCPCLFHWHCPFCQEFPACILCTPAQSHTHVHMRLASEL